MANVVDPNSWRMIPLTNSHSSNPARPDASRCDVAGEHAGPAVTRLAAALERTFDASHDRVLWLFEREHGEQQLRIDASHAAPSPAPVAETTPPAADVDPSWQVLVQTAQALAGESDSPEVRAALEQDARLLLVICGDTHDGLAENLQRQLAERVAARLRLPYHAPSSPRDEGELAGLLAQVKNAGESSVIYIDTAGSTPAPHSRLSKPDVEPLEQDGTYRDCVFASLREVQAANPAAVCVSIDGVREQAEVLLARCQASAAAGRHAFAFLAIAEVLEQLSSINALLCGEQNGITLIVEAYDEPSRSLRSATLAALRNLAGLSLVAPKDGYELSQMLSWCARQDKPSIVWLAETHLPAVAWPAGEEIATGRAEQLGAGTDVALVAWGSTNAAAAIAAEKLAKLNIQATVVNARFAQPLDVERLADVCAGTAYTVILDDANAGGFAAAVCEQIVRRRFGANLTIVSAEAVAPPRVDEHHQALAEAVVDRCRWLSKPLSGSDELPEARFAPIARTCETQSAAPAAFRLITSAGTPDVQAQVLATQFSPFIAQWVERYGRVGSRDVYLWRWCLHGLDLTTLSCVAPELRRDLCDTKLLAVMYGVMLDDVADHAGGEAFLAALTGIIAGSADRDFSEFTSAQQAYAQFTCELWDTFRNRLQRSPFYAEYADLLDYDHQQILNTFDYSLMVNKRLALLNVQEHDMYQPHNMQMMSFATMDLMCSPDFDRAELGRLREVIWHAQSMGRIGNLVSTWQREIADRDFTSGVFARALREGDLSLDDLETATAAEIEAAVRRGEHEQYFLNKWAAHRESIASLVAGIRSVDGAALLRALTQLLLMELNSRGFK